jgi:hypothetical protein
MRQIIIVGLLISLLMVSLSIAADKPTIYQKNGIEFAIPANWSVAKVEQLNSTQTDGSPINDTKIVLSDGKSAIRIDVIGIPQVKWLLPLYDDGPYYVCDILESFYRIQILSDSEKSEFGHSSSGSGLSVHPDDVEYAGFRTGNSGDLIEWTLAWTKPEYKDKFIGVHALFQKDYPMKSLSMPGGSGNYMQTPLYEILDSFSMSKKGASKQEIASEDLIHKI